MTDRLSFKDFEQGDPIGQFLADWATFVSALCFCDWATFVSSLCFSDWASFENPL
jgi:hypothetical protein